MSCCAGEHRQTAVRQLFIALALLIVSVSPAFAQLDRGTISGTIKDAQGGVMPGVTVTAVSTLNKQERSTVTDGSGFYTFANLQPGTYDITAELQGFKKASRQNVQLDAAGALAMDLALEAGAVTEVVTVTADTPLLQTDVAVRKTVEAKDIELLSFQGRNPIGVAGLKAGVSGGSNFNSRGFGDLGNGGYNINGSRNDENNITIDGATAIRTRSSGNIIGIQNVDAIQEVQVLTANYMPEYGRSSGGQIRFVTKSGSSNYTGSASFFYRDDSLQANSWARNRSPNAVENSGPAPFDYKQYGYAFGGPVPGSMFKDKLFFFGAQEWVNFFQVQTNSVTVPTAAMRNGDFSELLNPNNGFFSGARVINNPATGQPFPNNIIPTGMLSPNGRAIMNTYPLPTDGYRQGTANLIQTSESPTDQRKDHIRLDYRMNDRNSFTYRYSGYKFVELAAFFGNFPFARRIFDRPNETQTASWTSSISNTWINEFTYTYSRDNVFIDVYTDSGLYQRSRSGINYPLRVPGWQGDRGQDPDRQHRVGRLQLLRRRALPGVLGRPDPYLVERLDARPRPAYVQGRCAVRILGRGRLRSDQRQRDAGRHQQPERVVHVHRQPRQRHRHGHLERRDGPVQQLRRARSAQLHGVALARDRRVRPGFLEAAHQPDRRRRRALGLLAAVVLDDQQHRQLRSPVL